jgi:peptidoglycan/LPS O-acetylase OafA/YrhL
MRIKELDFLRGIAVLLVVFFHYPQVPYLEKTGYAGVDLFFVLSGFLISGLLFREQEKFGDVKPVRFLIRRGFKIYPLFYFFIILTLAAYVYYGDEINKAYILTEITFTRNFLGGFWVHTWTLCVEEHFYFAIAFLMFYIKRDRWMNIRKVNRAFIFFFVFSMVIEWLNVFAENHFQRNYFFNEWARRVQTQYCFDSLLYGVFISYHYRFNRERLTRFLRNNRMPLFLFSIAGALILPLYKIPYFNPLKDALLYVSYGNLLLLLITGTLNLNHLNFFLPWKWMVSLISATGVYSYSIYLFHVFIREMVMDKNENLSSLSFAFWIYFFLSIAASVLFSKIIEFPMLKIRDRYFPARS